MQPSHAEVARTLAAGREPAVVQVAHRPGTFPVRHVTDLAGRPLLLVPDGSPLAAALRPSAGNDTALVLDATDVPAAAGAPTLGRVWIAGWAAALSGEDARQAALEWLDTDITGDLLDIGHGRTLFRVDVAEIRLQRHGHTVDVDVDGYAAADPDPLHRMQSDVLADLADRYGTDLQPYAPDQPDRRSDRIS